MKSPRELWLVIVMSWPWFPFPHFVSFFMGILKLSVSASFCSSKTGLPVLMAVNGQTAERGAAWWGSRVILKRVWWPHCSKVDVPPRCSAYLPLDEPPQNTGICLPYFCHSEGKDPIQDNNHKTCSAQCLVKTLQYKHFFFFFFPERNERFLPHLGHESPHTSVACRNSPLCSLQMVSWR